MYNISHSFFTAGSSSATTSAPWYVGDFQSLSMDFGSAITVQVQGSNADGFTAAIPENTWSTVSTIAAVGLQKVETGFRWIRSVQSTSAQTILGYGQARR